MPARRPYKNLSGNSGVRAFEPGAQSIRLWFANGTSYEYDEKRPGKRHVDAMKCLAEAGKGLATYANQHVKDNYARNYELSVGTYGRKPGWLPRPCAV